MSDYEEHWQEREQLNEVRHRGPRGKRKPRKDGKPFTRRASTKELENEQLVIEVMVENLSKHLGLGARHKLADFIQVEFEFDARKYNSLAAFWEGILSSENRLLVQQANANYVRALALVYAVYLWVISDPDMQLHIQMMAEKAGVRIRRNTNLIGLVAQLVIDYRVTIPTADGSKVIINRRDISKDARAIEWLMQNGYQPATLIQRHRTEGGGPTVWSRLPLKGEPSIEDIVEAEIDARETEGKKTLEEYEAYFGDEESSQGADADADMDEEKPRKEKNWEEAVLNYCLRAKGLKDGEAMVLAVVGTHSGLIHARLSGVVNIGEIGIAAGAELNAFKMVAEAARKAYAAKGGG